MEFSWCNQLPANVINFSQQPPPPSPVIPIKSTNQFALILQIGGGNLLNKSASLGESYISEEVLLQGVTNIEFPITCVYGIHRPAYFHLKTLHLNHMKMKQENQNENVM